MSTRQRLRELVGGGILHSWSSPLQQLSGQKRQFWVTEHVAKILDAEPWAAGFFERQTDADDRRIRTHTMINQFIEGQNLTIGEDKQDSDLKCLKPIMRVADWRVWEMRPWQDRRLTRVLGHFAAPDQFVAFEVIARKIIFDWDKLAGRVDAQWLSLFPGLSPLAWNRPPSTGEIGSNFSHV